MKKTFALAAGWLAVCQFALPLARAWDYEGHRTVNQLALESLPANFPAFVLAPEARERIAFLAGEADRWRNVPDEIPFTHYSSPDHQIDLEELADYDLTPQTLPIFRYDLTAKLALARAAHPEKFTVRKAGLPDRDHTRNLVGFLPWAIVENYGKLKSEFSCLKTFQENGGTRDEIANAQANIIYVMGVMGHFVGDASQPLHTTIHHHGWVGENPHGFTTDRKIHQWIDGDYFVKTGGLKLETLAGQIRPAELVCDPAKHEYLFARTMTFIVEQNKQVEPLYQLYKDGKFTGEGEKGLEGKAFLEAQLVKGGQLLGGIWYTAWQQAPEDGYLKAKLVERKAASDVKK